MCNKERNGGKEATTEQQKWQTKTNKHKTILLSEPEKNNLFFPMQDVPLTPSNLFLTGATQHSNLRLCVVIQMR